MAGYISSNLILLYGSTFLEIVGKSTNIDQKIKLKNLLNQYRTLQTTWYGCMGRSYAPSEKIWGKLEDFNILSQFFWKFLENRPKPIKI